MICILSSSLSVFSIVAKPYFIGDNYPKDKTVLEQQSASFMCKVTADPEATVTWYINGNEIVDGEYDIWLN